MHNVGCRVRSERRKRILRDYPRGGKDYSDTSEMTRKYQTSLGGLPRSLQK